MDLPGDDLVTVVAGGVPVAGTVDEQEDVDDISVDGGHRTGAVTNTNSVNPVTPEVFTHPMANQVACG